MGYLTLSVKTSSTYSLDDPRKEAIGDLFERALVFMHKMPLVWFSYIDFLVSQRYITRTRRACDRALQALPITQHLALWPRYLDFAKSCGCRDTCVRVFRRYLQLCPTDRKDFVHYLTRLGDWDEAALQLTHLVNSGGGISGNSHSLWLELCEIVSRHPKDVTSVPVEAVLRSGIGRFSDEVGRMWCALAEHFVRLGEFERARDVYEEAVVSVRTVRDFAAVFDAYVQFEEALVTARLEMIGVGEGGHHEGHTLLKEGDAEPFPGQVTREEDLDDLNALSLADADDTELRMSRLELLMDRRPLLLSSVLLRQNPHNIHEWHNRAKLYKSADNPAKVIATYAEGLKTVDPTKAVGKLPSLWSAFARFYEGHGDMDNARIVLKNATEASFKSVDDLASIWCEWGEMELRAKEYGAALRVMQEAVRDKEVGLRGRRTQTEAKKGDFSVKLRLNQRVWGLYLDLEESLGTFETVKAAYDEVISLRVVTPAMILNFAAFCEEKGYFEEGFRAFERGVALFQWPQVKELWLQYLTKFVERYGGSKLERARDLFEQAVTGIPPTEASSIYLAYAHMEERYGLARHVMAVYDRAVSACDDNSRYSLFLAYISKAEESFGAPRTREIYARAIEVLPEKQVPDMCMRFADLETKLGELERARAIFAHAANFCDPKKHVLFWQKWQEWETAHGNEESFTDMLRTKRSVAALMASAYSGVMDLLEKAQEKDEGAVKRPRLDGGH